MKLNDFLNKYYKYKTYRFSDAMEELEKVNKEGVSVVAGEVADGENVISGETFTAVILGKPRMGGMAYYIVLEDIAEIACTTDKTMEIHHLPQSGVGDAESGEHSESDESEAEDAGGL